MTGFIEKAEGEVVQFVEADLTWLQKHTVLIVSTMIICSALWLGNKWIDHSGDTTSKAATVAATLLSEQKDINAKQAAVIQQQSIEYTASLGSMMQQNAALAQQITARDAALQQRQTAAVTMPVPDLLARWQTLIGAKPGEVAVTPNGNVVSDSAARTTVSQLEEIPVLKADIAGAQTIAAGTQTQLNKANDLIGGLNTQVSGLNKQIVDKDISCKADVAAVKADARKSKRNWFLRGMATGAGVAAYIAVHLI